MTIRSHADTKSGTDHSQKPWFIAATFAALTISAAGCKSNAIQRHPHALNGGSAPATSSAVTDVPASVVEQERSAYDKGVQHASEAYDDVNKMATKAAGDLKAGANQAGADVAASAKQKASALRQGVSNATDQLRKSTRARAEVATDDLLNAIGPKNEEPAVPAAKALAPATAPAVPDVVIPDETAGRP